MVDRSRGFEVFDQLRWVMIQQTLGNTPLEASVGKHSLRGKRLGNTPLDEALF